MTTNIYKDYYYNNIQHTRPFPKESIRVIFIDNLEFKEIRYFGNFKNPMKILLNYLLYQKTPKTTACYILENKIK